MNIKLGCSKRMFWFVFLGIVLATGLNSCSKDEITGKVPPSDLDITTIPDSFSVSNKSGLQKVNVTSDISWKAVSDVEWITIHTEKGEKGEENLVFTIAENDGPERSGTITITSVSAAGSKEIKIIQQAGPPDESNLKANFYVKPGGLGDGSSWNNASDLNYALQNAIQGSVIHLAAGTYVPSLTITNGDLSDQGDNTFEIKQNITLRGGYPANIKDTSTPAEPEVNKTILSGNNTVYHVVAVSASQEEGHKVILEGLVLTGGNSAATSSNFELNDTKFYRNEGGGLYVGNAKVELNHCEVIENKSGNACAGIFIFGNGDLTINDSKINNNVSATGNGAGVWAYTSTVSIYNSEINNNEATKGVAPGIYAYLNSSLQVFNTSISNNTGNSYGAGVYIRGNTNAVFVNCLIQGNQSGSKNGGGGLMMYDNCDAVFVSSTITGNVINGPGGGIYRRSGSNTLSVYNSIISGNEQKSGSSDLDVYESSAPDPIILSSVIGDKLYDHSGNETSGVFDVNTMLSAQFIPTGSSNPALTDGMDAAALTAMANDEGYSIESIYLNADMNGESRSGKTVMGPLLP